MRPSPSTTPFLRISILSALAALLPFAHRNAWAGPLLAGVAKVDVTHREANADPFAPPAKDTLYAKALVLRKDERMAVLITVDAVAIGEIGPIGNDYLGKVRAALEQEFGVPPTHVFANASHCHGIVCPDVAERTVQAARLAAKDLVPVTAAVGVGRETRVSENRRLTLKDGREADVRHAYSLPPDELVQGVGPIDPEIGVLRLDRRDGRPLAVVYNFACHPIQGVPGRGGNTADLTGFANSVIEAGIGDGAIALFVQGCAGDINPVMYKDTGAPRDAETLGNLLGVSTMIAAKALPASADDPALVVVNEPLRLPRANHADRIVALQAQQLQVLRTLRGCSLNFKTFLPLMIKYNVSREFPSYYSHRYLHDEKFDRRDFDHLDAENRANLHAYLQNIHSMEELTRLQTNLALLEKHQREFEASATRAVDVEVGGLRIGDFTLVTFPGELTVPIGLAIKKRAPRPRTFVAGYTNGYIYYAPTKAQARNIGYAQEDCDCILDPDWQDAFDKKVDEVLGKL